jgi:EAL domain-containing protein (putative c-di-GMP-specific phosphodiesterase class I)
MTPTSTIAVTPRFLYERPRSSQPEGWSDYRCPGESSSFCSAAGLQRRPWLGRLRRALAADLFELHYQPIACLETGKVSHYEALLRLADEPDGPLVAPHAFLPAAERHGLIQDIDRMVISKVIALIGDELAESDICVAVNLSALSIIDTQTLSHIEAELARHRVAPKRLIFELTETAAISDMARAKEFCERVSDLGCAVALDDFGVGFGSFYYVKHLPFSFLKIDGDFIRELPSSPSDQRLVTALVEVARGMGMQTVAEFVGDTPTVELLRELGVDYAQGFEIGRPRPAIPMVTSIA